MGRERLHWGEVIALSEYRKLPELPEIAQVRAYWERLRGPRVAPARSEIDPKAIAPALSYAFVLDRIAPGHARIRLAGMHLCDLMGMEVRGMPLATLFQLPSRELLSGLLGEIFAGQTTLNLLLKADRGLGRPALEAQMLMLPLADRQGGLSRALGCLVASGEIGYPPRRFTIAEVCRSRIAGVQPLPEAAPLPAAGFAEPPVRFHPRPVLRVVRGDE